MKKYSLALLMGWMVTLMLSGCDHKDGDYSYYAGESSEHIPLTKENIMEPLERKLIREGRLSFETKDIKATRETVFRAVESFQAYVASDQEFRSDYSFSNTITIRVPSDKFDAFMAEATKGVKRFESREINIRDVTEEFLDINARLKTKKELEARYLELLKQARTVSEMLEIEQQIGVLRSDIESIEGRLQVLNNLISYSTLTLTFYENLPDQNGFVQKLKKGFVNGWDNLVAFIVFMVNFWPFLILVAFTLLVLKIYKRKK